MAPAKEQRWFHLLGMSTRTGNAVDALLAKHGCSHDLYELTKFSALDLIRFPGIGRESIREIVMLLAEAGYSLAVPPEGAHDVELGELRIVVRRQGDMIRRMRARLRERGN